MSLFVEKNRIRFAGAVAALGPAVALGSMALLSGCHVGPHYHAPTPTQSPRQLQGVDRQLQDTAAGRWPAENAMLRGNWWEVFNDPELNALEEQLNINNET